MPRNLDEKIGLLLEDINSLTREEAAKKIKSLIEGELDFHRATHYLDGYDLTRIHSVAVNEMISLNTNAMRDMGLDNHRMQALSYVRALVGELRRLGLISFIVDYTPKNKL